MRILAKILKRKEMKSLIILVMTALTLSLHAQEIMQMEKSMSLGPQNAFYVEIDDTPEKVVEKEWKDYLKEYSKKVKYNRKAKEHYTEGAKVAVINGTGELTLYSKIEEGKDQVTVYLWTDMGNGFVNTKDFSKQADGVDRFLRDFYILAKKKGIQIELDEEEKELKGLEKDLEKLEKQNKDLHQDIEDYKEKIRRAEADIESNLKAQDDKRVEIENQKKVIEQVIERLNMVGKTY